MNKTHKILTIVIILLIGFSSTSEAQLNKIMKVQKYYLDEDYEKCIKKSEKFSEKYPKTADFYFFKSLSYFQLIQNTDNEFEKKKLSRKIVKNIRKAYKYKKFEDQFADYNVLVDSVQIFMLKTADELFKKYKGQSKYYYDNLAEIFNDTCENYYVFHPEVISSEIGKQDIVPDSNVDSKGKRKDMLNVAKDLVGTKYLWTGEDPKGFDCSGFTMYLYQQIGYNLPHSAQMQSQLGITIPIEDAMPGDLIFFGYRTNDSYKAVHAGVVYANNAGVIDLVHCVSGGVNIHQNDNSNNRYWLERALFVKRIIDEESCENLIENNK